MSQLQSVRRAALFVADVLASANLAPFLKKHNIKDKKYGQRLIDRLRTKHSLAPASRPGRPRTYTKEQLAAGQAELSRPSHPHHSKAELVRLLKEEERLPASAKSRGYGAALKRSLGEQGLQLGYGPRTKQHAITAADKRDRLAWCLRMQPIITDATVKDWWFEDEKMINGAGKMRGEWGRCGGVWTAVLQAPAGCASGLALHCVCERVVAGARSPRVHPSFLLFFVSLRPPFFFLLSNSSVSVCLVCVCAAREKCVFQAVGRRCVKSNRSHFFLT